MFSLIRTQKLEQTSQDLETEKLYNKTLSHLHDNIRCFKHDFNNIVQALGGYIALNDMAGLKEYYNNYIANDNENLKSNVIELMRLTTLFEKKYPNMSNYLNYRLVVLSNNLINENNILIIPDYITSINRESNKITYKIKGISLNLDLLKNQTHKTKFPKKEYILTPSECKYLEKIIIRNNNEMSLFQGPNKDFS